MRMKRSLYDLSHARLATTGLTTLTPILCEDVLPGDSWAGETTILIRMKGMQRPYMGALYADLHAFYVPNRLAWDGWVDWWVSEGTTGAIPTLTTGPLEFGYPQPISNADRQANWGGSLPVFSALPMRAYNLVYNTYFIDKSDSPVALTSNALHSAYMPKDGLNVARPSKMDFVGSTQLDVDISDDLGLSGVSDQSTLTKAQLRTALRDELRVRLDTDDLPKAASDMRWDRMKALLGDDYGDLLRAMGVSAPPSVDEEPEFLGRERQIVTVTDIPATSDSTGTNVGDLAGHGLGVLKFRLRRKNFSEHGWLMYILSLRPKAMYSWYSPAYLRDTSWDDYWTPMVEGEKGMAVSSLNRWQLDDIDKMSGGWTDFDQVLGYLPHNQRYAERVDHASNVGLKWGGGLKPQSRRQLWQQNANSYKILFNDTKNSSQQFHAACHHDVMARRGPGFSPERTIL